MELHQVQYFLALARTLNFTRAAEQCNITQPALTKAVQKLERELGGALVHRERQLTHLTDLGKVVLPIAERVLAAANSVQVHAQQFQQRAIAPLKIGLPPCVSASLVTPCLSQVEQSIPGLQIEFVELDLERLPNLLMSGEINIAVAGELGNCPDRLNQWPLFQERYVVLASPEHPFAQLDVVPLEALSGAIWLERVGCRVGPRLWNLVPKHAHRRVSHRAHQDNHLQHLAAAGLGVMLAPEHTPILPTLVARAIVGDPIYRSVQLFAVGGRLHTPALEAFVKTVRLRDWSLALRDTRA